MAYENQRPGLEFLAGMRLRQELQRHHVRRIGQHGCSPLRRAPQDAVHLLAVGTYRRSVGDFHRPVVNHLQARGHVVVDRRQRDAQRHLQPDLFFDFPDSAFGDSLAGVELAFRPGPVVVLGPVDQENLQLVLLDTPRQGAGGRDGYWLAGVVSLVRY
jgi:hypothetical protein